MKSLVILKNGIRVLHVEERRESVYALGLSVGAGTYFEDDKSGGISHLLEHLIGRSDIEGFDFRETVYKGGGVLDASTSIYKTYYYLMCLSDNFERLSGLFLNGIFQPNLTDKDLRDSKESIVSEFAYMEDVEPYKILREMMWKDPRLSKSIAGTKSTILPLSLTELKKYHGEHYIPASTSVILLGPDLPQYLLKSLENIPSVSKLPVENPSIGVNFPTFRIFQDRNMSSSVTVSFPTKGFEGMGEGKHYFNLAVSTLIESRISKLGSEGLIYNESWVWNIFPTNGDLVLFIDSVDHAHLLPTIKKLTAILEDWGESPISQSEFDVIRGHKILDLKMHASVSEKLMLLTKSFSTSEEVHTYEEAIATYAKTSLKTTLDSVRKTLLTTKPFIVVSCGVDSEAEVGKVEEYLEKYYEK